MRAVLINMTPPKSCLTCKMLMLSPCRCALTGEMILRSDGRPRDCPLIEVELVEDEEAIVPVNMIGGYLKREAEHEEMSDQ